MSDLEKESLEAHVDLRSERYNGLHRELKNLGSPWISLKNAYGNARHDNKTKTERNPTINWLGYWNH